MHRICILVCQDLQCEMNQITSGERAAEDVGIAYQGAARGAGGRSQHQVQGEESQHHGGCYLD